MRCQEVGRVWRKIVLLVLVQGLVGCGGTGSGPAQTAPSAVPHTAPEPAPIQLVGFVYDSAVRPLGGAGVEVLDGPQTGASTTADTTGRFSLTGTFNDTTRFRATSDGHVAATATLNPACASCATRYISFYLAVPAPPASIAGNYTLTFIADSVCDLPDEVRTRTYAATITPESQSDRPANTLFSLTPSGAFLEYYGHVPISVAGEVVAFELRGEGPNLVEVIAPKTYLGFYGRAEASVGTTAVSRISTSFNGTIDYCVLSSEMGEYYDCSASRAVTHAQCQSKNHRLILTRR